MKRISKKVAMQCDENMLNYHYQQLDKTYCLSWHRGTGMFIEEWCNYLETYAKKRGRDLFFSTNEWNVPCCFFDATNEKEWKKWMVNSGKYAKKWGNVSIKKMWRNPELEQGTKQ